MARLSARDGRRVGLGDVRARDIDPIAELGFDLIWLTAAWTIGSGSRRMWRASPDMRGRRAALLPDGSDDDIVGSPYAVSAYEPPDSLGGEEGLARLRGRLAEAGLGLLLDFVPNHTSAEHPWVRRHPDWYVHADGRPRAAGRRMTRSSRSVRTAAIGSPTVATRTSRRGQDTAQLDYRHPDVPRAMTQTLREVATRCDGVVCSMAMLVLDDVFRSTWDGRSAPPATAEEVAGFGEFWWHATSAVRDVYPRFLLVGEAYWGLEWRLQQLGFDFTWDHTLLERFLARDPASVTGHLRADDTYQRRSVRLLEARDGPRIASRMTPGEERVAALVEAAVPGMLLVRDGQITGARQDVPVQLRREPDGTGRPGPQRLLLPTPARHR